MNRRMDKWNRQIDGQMDRWALRTLEGEGTSRGLTPLWGTDSHRLAER